MEQLFFAEMLTHFTSLEPFMTSSAYLSEQGGCTIVRGRILDFAATVSRTRSQRYDMKTYVLLRKTN